MCDSGCNNSCNCVKSKLGNSILGNSERDELERLRKQNKVLMDLCLGEKLESVWNYGYQSGIFTKGDLSVELKKDLWNEDRESIIQDELSNLEIGDES